VIVVVNKETDSGYRRSVTDVVAVGNQICNKYQTDRGFRRREILIERRPYGWRALKT
jgi:hypothetical protein